MGCSPLRSQIPGGPYSDRHRRRNSSVLVVTSASEAGHTLVRHMTQALWSAGLPRQLRALSSNRVTCAVVDALVRDRHFPFVAERSTLVVVQRLLSGTHPR